MHKYKKILKGHQVNVKDGEIVDVCFHTPNLSKENYHKMNKAYEKGKGCRLKLSEHELKGCGLGQIAHEVKKDVEKVGKKAIKSGIADIAVDEAVNLLPLPSIAKKVASKVIKDEAHYLTGTGVNPYLPTQLAGSGFTSEHTKMSYLSSNIQGSKLAKPINHGMNTQLSYMSDGIQGKKY